MAEEMNANELSDLIDKRYATLSLLTEISQRQIAAIDDNRMSDLMRILSEKQQPIVQLSEITKRLAAAAGDDPRARVWESEAARQRCRRRQEECETMHLGLLAIEAECETSLKNSRAAVQEKLARFDSGRQAATRYAQSQSLPPSGGRLDLSSDS